MINRLHKLSLERQCELLEVNRSSYYYKPIKKDEEGLKKNIMTLYQKYPIYGYRRITAYLKQDNLIINHKKVLRLMRNLQLKAIYPGVVTTKPAKGALIYPNLLKGLEIIRPHQVYQTDITYLRTLHGFMYLVAIIDAYSRYIVSWRLSNTLSRASCLKALEDALGFYPCLDILHSDQGCQFTSHDWIKTLQAHQIQVSMSGQGKSCDNAKIERLWRTLKYEYLPFVTVTGGLGLKKVIGQFVHWYNTQRLHQSLEYKTPQEYLLHGQNLNQNPLFTYKKEENIMVI